MSCSANSDRPRKIVSCIQAANTVLTQFDRATIFVKSFGALCSSTYVQAVSLEPIYIYIIRLVPIPKSLTDTDTDTWRPIPIPIPILDKYVVMTIMVIDSLPEDRSMGTQCTSDRM